ncbi:MAG: hypothetical protein QM820_21560 [Minicystis sp.]
MERDFNAFFEVEIRAVAGGLGWAPSTLDPFDIWARALEALCAPATAGPAIAAMRQLYRALLGPPPARDPRDVAELVARDPLADWLAPAPGFALPETRFATRALRYLSVAPSDRRFAKLFWQYQRVRSITFRHLVEEPGTAGLDWFRRHFDRIFALNRTLWPVDFHIALELESGDVNLDSFEVRKGPPARWAEVREDVRRLARAARDHRVPAGQRPPEVGLVLHFLKEREIRGEHRLHADPRQRSHSCRFGAWSKARQDQARAIATALRHNPELLLVLRGIDMASVELAVPNWPFVPIFEIVRRASNEASALLKRRWPEAGIKPLRTTVHAGEDFRRLSEGLRRIHELIEFGLIQAGDRIGHGIALGESPKRWARGAHEVAQPMEERLDDLLWELDRYRHAHLPLDARRLEFVRAASLRLGGEIYGEGSVTVETLLAARSLRHDGEWLRGVGYPFTRRSRSETGAAALAHRHLTDPEVFERGQRPERVRVDDAEVAMLRAAGAWLRREVGRLEITVESNPSSNLLIGDFVDISAHPVFRMAPLRGREPRGGPPVLLSINDDDPITFATRLADEFAYVYFALLRSGVSAHDALAWIDAIRANGMRSKFTLPASRAAEGRGQHVWLDRVINPRARRARRA